MKPTLEKLYPLNRHLVGDDNKIALKMIKDALGGLTIHAYPTNLQCWTWRIPEKWVIRSSYIECEDGRRFAQFEEHPLHVISYSLPVDKVVSKAELLSHLHTSKKQPEAIPYVTKYYERDWGFCLSKVDAEKLTGDTFKVFIDAEHIPGELLVGEYNITGESEQTVIIVTNICHPAQVNDSISGVVVAVDLIKELAKRNTHFSYKFLFLPETIGSIAWLSQNEQAIPNICCGLFFEMLGTENEHLLQHSFTGKAKIDKIALSILEQKTECFRTTEFRKGPASDEMIFDGPGINKPMINLSRFPYPEYHTSFDNPDIISEAKLQESRDVLLKILLTLDQDRVPVPKYKGPIFLSGYGLWTDWQKNRAKDTATPVSEDEAYLLNIALDYMMILIDGSRSIFDVYWILKNEQKFPVKFSFVQDFIYKLHGHQLVEWKEDLT